MSVKDLIAAAFNKDAASFEDTLNVVMQEKMAAAVQARFSPAVYEEEINLDESKDDDEDDSSDEDDDLEESFASAVKKAEASRQRALKKAASMVKRGFSHEAATKNHDVKVDELKKHMNEEVEQIDELSKKTLSSYIKKASDNAATHGMKYGEKKAQSDEMDRMMNRHMSYSDKDKVRQIMKTTSDDVEAPRYKAAKRLKGIDRAVDKLSK